MLLSCCGEIFNTVGKTFFQIDRYKTSPQNRIFEDRQTVEEFIYVTVCQNCGHMIIKYRQRIKNKAGKKKLGNTLNLRGQEADEFFYKNYEKFIDYPLESPFDNEKQSKTIPFIYGKVIDGQTQQPFYIDESEKVGNPINAPVKKSSL